MYGIKIASACMKCLMKLFYDISLEWRSLEALRRRVRFDVALVKQPQMRERNQVIAMKQVREKHKRQSFYKIPSFR